VTYPSNLSDRFAADPRDETIRKSPSSHTLQAEYLTVAISVLIIWGTKGL